MIVKCKKPGAGSSFGALGRYMADRIGENAGGGGREDSFENLASYMADNEERVGLVETRNLAFSDTERVVAEMRMVASVNERVQKPCQHIIVSFNPEDRPTGDMLKEAGTRVLKDMGLGEHQALIVSHHDRDHAHVHIMVNRVNPETYKACNNGNNYYKAREVAIELEKEMGLVATRQNAGAKDNSQGAIAVAQKQGRAVFVGHVRSASEDAFKESKTWKELETRLRDVGLSLERKGQGLVVTDGVTQVKASGIRREYSMKRLEERFGPYAERNAAANVNAAAKVKTKASGSQASAAASPPSRSVTAVSAPGALNLDVAAKGAARSVASQGKAQVESMVREAGLGPDDVEQNQLIHFTKEGVQKVWHETKSLLKSDLSQESYKHFTEAERHARAASKATLRIEELKTIESKVKYFSGSWARQERAQKEASALTARLPNCVADSYQKPPEAFRRIQESIRKNGATQTGSALQANPGAFGELRKGGGATSITEHGRNMAAVHRELESSSRTVKAAQESLAYYGDRLRHLKGRSLKDSAAIGRAERQMKEALSKLSGAERKLVAKQMKGFRDAAVKDAARRASRSAGRSAVQAATNLSTRTAGAALRSAKAMISGGRMIGSVAVPLAIAQSMGSTAFRLLQKASGMGLSR